VVASTGLLLAWIAFHIWGGHDELWGHGVEEFGGIFPRQPLIGILAISLCLATALGYLVAAVAVIQHTSWSGPVVAALAVPAAIGALYGFVFGAANTWAIGFPSGQLMFFGFLALALTVRCDRAVRDMEVGDWPLGQAADGTPSLSGSRPGARPEAVVRIALAVAFAGPLFAWIALHIWSGYDELWRHAQFWQRYALEQGRGYEFGGLLPGQSLIILAVSLCAATALGYLVATVALIGRIPLSRALITALAVPGAIGALYGFVVAAANIRYMDAPEALMFLGIVALFLIVQCARIVWHVEVKSWLAGRTAADLGKVGPTRDQSRATATTASTTQP
jgi:hypothetical protein